MTCLSSINNNIIIIINCYSRTLHHSASLSVSRNRTFPNVLFVTLVIFGTCLLTRGRGRRKHTNYRQRSVTGANHHPFSRLRLQLAGDPKQHTEYQRNLYLVPEPSSFTQPTPRTAAEGWTCSQLEEVCKVHVSTVRKFEQEQIHFNISKR